MSSSSTNKFYEWAAFGSGSGSNCSGTSLISNQTIPTNKCIPVLNPKTLTPLFYNVSSLSTEIPGQNITTVTISQSYYAENNCSTLIQSIPPPPPPGIPTEFCIPYFNPALGVTNQTVNNPSDVISYPPGLSVM